MPELSNQSAADNTGAQVQTEWERYGFASKAEINLAVYELENQRAKERIKRRQVLYEMGFLTADQLYNNR
jgi:hypothetical protein